MPHLLMVQAGGIGEGAGGQGPGLSVGKILASGGQNALCQRAPARTVRVGAGCEHRRSRREAPLSVLHLPTGRREFSLVVKKSRFHTEGTVR